MQMGGGISAQITVGYTTDHTAGPNPYINLLDIDILYTRF